MKKLVSVFLLIISVNVLMGQTSKQVAEGMQIHVNDVEITTQDEDVKANEYLTTEKNCQEVFNHVTQKAQTQYGDPVTYKNTEEETTLNYKMPENKCLFIQIIRKSNGACKFVMYVL